MTETQESSGALLKTDQLHRVRTPAARREELLHEFEQSGLSGPKFAALAGLKYQTFAAWVQRRRKRSGDGGKNKPAAQPLPGRWLEAVLEQGQPSVGPQAPCLTVRLMGGARLEIRQTEQVPLAAALLRALEKPSSVC